MPLLQHLRSAQSSLQAAAMPEFCSFFPQQDTHLVFSTLMLCFLVNPEIWHRNYLSKKALKLACIRQQKHMSRVNGQIRCPISLLFLCN